MVIEMAQELSGWYSLFGFPKDFTQSPWSKTLGKLSSLSVWKKIPKKVKKQSVGGNSQFFRERDAIWVLQSSALQDF